MAQCTFATAFACAALLSASIGCTTWSTAPVANDAGSDASPVANDGGAPANETCNQLEQRGTGVVTNGSSSPPPASTGGGMADGIYRLSGAKVYDPKNPDGPLESDARAPVTAKIRGDTFDMVVGSPAEARVTMHLSWPDTSTVVMTPTCTWAKKKRTPETETWQYSATPGEIVLRAYREGQGTVEMTFTKL